jgi:hypothetical protein
MVESDDLAAGAVDHPQSRSGVAAAHHSVADPELPVGDLKDVGPEAAILRHQFPCGSVQVSRFRSGEGDHAGLLALAEPLPPVAHLRGVGFRLGAADDNLAVGHQPVECLVLAAGAEQRGDLLAEFRLLPVVAAQFGGAQPQPEGAERAADIDGGKLPVVADHDHLASGPVV